MQFFFTRCRRIPVNCRSFAKNQPPSNSQYSKTVLVPKSKFPVQMTASDRVDMDKRLHSRYGFDQLYDWQRSREYSVGSFVLHDGPPYANGQVHVGHALNKILKDITVRYKVMTGYKVHMKPGWDCHGLPIELKVHNFLKTSGPQLSAEEIRSKARSFAQEAINDQRTAFKRWGVMADWDHPYCTFDKSYEAKELEIFRQLWLKGYIYRDLKPTYWSPSSKTALAEAELEYVDDHKSLAAYVKFPVEKSSGSDNLFAVIWTTTLWSLPCNDVICFNPDEEYVVIKQPGCDDQLLVGCGSLASLPFPYERLGIFPRDQLKNLSYRHLFTHKSCPFVAASHVGTEKGTGLVHTAYAHGFDDFAVAKARGDKVASLVMDSGLYSDDCVPQLAGIDVAKGSEVVANLIPQNIVFSETYSHRYPYDWRTKKPVIIRASKQWFIDTEAFKSKALEILDKQIVVVPPEYKKNLHNHINSRPHWCISRQRVWGTPIPYVVDRVTDESHMCDSLIDQVTSVIRESGSDAWWSKDISQFLTPRVLSDLKREPSELNSFKKGSDILDIWFDSGVSWAVVQPESGPIDVVLEGIDQFRGWFQSLLLTAIASDCGNSPFKRILTHSFVTDDQGNKMSKSLGNVINPYDVTDGLKKSKTALGADGLRLWAASCGLVQSKTRMSAEFLATLGDKLKQIRVVLRFILGATSDLGHETLVEVKEMPLIDQYLLHLCCQYINEVEVAYDSFEYDRVVNIADAFFNGTVSNFYCSMIKDRLYCDSRSNKRRRAAQSVLKCCGEVFISSLAPILPHLAAEFHQHSAPSDNSEVPSDAFKKGWQSYPQWQSDSTKRLFETRLLPLRNSFLSQHGMTRTDHLHLIISTADSLLLADLDQLQPQKTSCDSALTELLKVSQVSIEEGSGKETQLRIGQPHQFLCDRCRRYCRGSHDQLLCDRCTAVLSA